MRTRAFLATFLLLFAAGARAENPFSCASSGPVSKLSFDSARTKISFKGTFALPSGFDPIASGLTLDLLTEPETDPANAHYSVTLPAGGFTQTPSGLIRYKDSAGAVGGITSVKIKTLSTGDRRITVKRKGSVLALPPGGVFRMILTSGGACVRHCGASCSQLANGKLKCQKSTDTALCQVKSGCELLNPSGRNCLFPYPSSFFLRDDATTSTGKRMNYGPGALPANASGVHIDPTAWNAQLDGFSPGTMMLLNFPQGVDVALSNLNTWQDYTPSVNPATSPTILLDYDTGELVEHFAEVDVSIAPGNVPVAPPNQAMIIRPGRRLKNGGHYVVAVRNLVAPGGAPITAEPAFAALRDGTPTGNHLVEPRRSAFEEIFSRLEDAGVARAGLTLAWDFHVASDDAIQRWLLHMRNETLQQLGPNAPPFTVTTVVENPNPGQICRRVSGTFQVPLYTTFNGPGSVLAIGPDGNPEQNGIVNAPFTAIIPCSLSTVPQPGRVIFYGHGLLGSGAGEVGSSHLRNLAQTYGYVVVATDWQGMSDADVENIVISVTPDLTNFRQLSERLHQGVLNQLVLAHLLKAPDGLSSDPNFIYAGVPVIDNSDVFYYGNSQGGIFGGTVMSLATETTRGVLGVPAANFSTLLQRSRDFDPYFVLIRLAYPDDLNRMLTYPLIQQLWDKSEPNGWYHRTVSNPLPGTPAHKVLVHMATSDDEVTTVACEIMVRSMGIPQVAPPVKSYYNIAEQLAPFDGSAMVESDQGDPPIPIGNIPPADNNAHGAMRARPPIQAQIDQFLRTGGNVQNFCVGPCDPE
jgi:hypothetical protein